MIQRDQGGTLNQSARPSSTCRSMALEIIKLYISSLSSFFTLSDAAMAETKTQTSRKDNEGLAIPPFVPVGTSVLCAAHFSTQLLEELADCVGELHVGDIGGEATNGLKAVLENMRWRMVEVVTATWAKGEQSIGLITLPLLTYLRKRRELR